jgi:hypothetical protein
MSPGTRTALGAAGGSYEADDSAWLSSVNAAAGSVRAFSRTVRDVIDWRGKHRHFRDGPSDLAPLPPIALLWGDRDTIIPIMHAYHTAPLLGALRSRGSRLAATSRIDSNPRSSCERSIASWLRLAQLTPQKRSPRFERRDAA